MEQPQNVTTTLHAKGDETKIPVPWSELNNIQRAYVDYKAISGLITTDDGIRKMTVDELASQLGVDRRTVYRNKDMVPNFWDLVDDRRKELFSGERLTKMLEVWYLKAMGSGPQAFQYFQLYMANFNPGFRMPTQKLEHDYGQGMADLIASVRAKQQKERKVIDVDPQSQNNT